MILTMEIVPKEVSKKDGGKWTKYVTLTKDGWAVVKFVDGCKNKPSKHCLINVDSKNANLKLSEKGGYKNRVIWVKEVDEILPDKELQKIIDSRAEHNEQALIDAINTKNDADNLPF